MYVYVGTDNNNGTIMINQVILGKELGFTGKALPFVDRIHNNAFYVTIACQERIIKRVLVDDKSGLNICPLLTLRLLKFD